MLLAVVVLGACSGDDGGDDPDAARPSTTTTAPLVFTGDPDGAFCQVLREYSGPDVLGSPSETPEQVEAAYTSAIEILGRIADAAPPELVEDTALVLEGFVALDAALRPVGYDADALLDSPAGPEVVAAVNDPAFAVAGDRIAAYKAQVCTG